MNKPIGRLIISEDFPSTEEGNKIYFEKVRMFMLNLEKKYEGLPSCCKIVDALARKTPEGFLEKLFYIECSHDE